MRGGQKLQLELVPLERKPELHDLMQVYLAELAEYSGESAGSSGLYDDPYFDLYWQEETRYPFFITWLKQVIGFVLVRRLVEHRQEIVHSVAEFYVQPGYRQQEVGREAAKLVFKRFPGWWRVAQQMDNKPAQVFWRRVINEISGGNYNEISQPDWDGPILEFYID